MNPKYYLALLAVIHTMPLWGKDNKYILFTPNKGRIRSKLVLPETTKTAFQQPNYFEVIDGNPLIKIWIEQELAEETFTKANSDQDNEKGDK